MVSATVIKDNIVYQVSSLFTHGIATFTTSTDSYLTAKEKQEGIPALFDAITTIEISPSLKLYFREVFAKCYAKARKKASLETGLPISTFPTESLFTPEETLDTEYLPD